MQVDHLGHHQGTRAGQGPTLALRGEAVPLHAVHTQLKPHAFRSAHFFGGYDRVAHDQHSNWGCLEAWLAADVVSRGPAANHLVHARTMPGDLSWLCRWLPLLQQRWLLGLLVVIVRLVLH